MNEIDKVLAYKSKNGRVGLKPTTSLLESFGLSESMRVGEVDWVWLSPAQSREFYSQIDFSVMKDLERGWRLCVRLSRNFTASVFNY